MPDPKRIRIYYEGNDDKAILEKLRVANVLPVDLEIADREKDKHPGKDGLVQQVLPFLAIGGHAIILVDLDEATFEQRWDWFRVELEQAARQRTPPPAVALGVTINDRAKEYRIEVEGRVGVGYLVPVGLPNDAELKQSFGIDRFAVDDFILNLVRNRRVFEAVREFHSVPFDIAMKKLHEVAALFRSNGLEVRKAKTYVQMLRAVASIAPSTSTIVGRVVEKAVSTMTGDELRIALLPLLDDLLACHARIQAL